MNKLVKDALILTAITLIAGVCLGGVYEITKGPIAQAQVAATQAAYKEVFQDAASFADLEGFDAKKATAVVAEAGYTDDEINNCVVAQDNNGETLGYVITLTSHAGYGGDIVLSMGVTKDGVLNGYSITDISETAGLGMKAKEDAFMNQFKGIQAQILEVTKGGKSAENEIEAISGATITSKAVTYGIDAGLTYYSSIVGGASNE
ncbi:MAG: RnfABCDGE type electron transport complex subunit G [Lachnospiraceae bacterium]|nr:RnfABCDGE type electron transport complex subunit G [Lachnospiraceae bacterium]